MVQICPDIREERVKNTSGHLRAIQVVPVAPAPPEGCGCNMLRRQRTTRARGRTKLDRLLSIRKGLWMVVTCEFLPGKKTQLLHGKRLSPWQVCRWDLLADCASGCNCAEAIRGHWQLRWQLGDGNIAGLWSYKNYEMLSSIYQLPGNQPVFIKAFHRSWLDTDVRKVKGARWREGRRIAEAAGFQVHSKSCHIFSQRSSVSLLWHFIIGSFGSLCSGKSGTMASLHN